MLIETKYSIGDVVYTADVETTKKTMPCPDCNDTKKWKAISPAGGEYEFPCPRCSTSYRSDHRMNLTYLQFAPMVGKVTIGAVRADTLDAEGNIYMAVKTGVGSGRLYRETALFATEEEATAAAQAKADAANAGAVPWVKEQYDQLLEVCDYQLSDARTAVARAEASKARYRLADFVNSIEDCESLEEVREAVAALREE